MKVLVTGRSGQLVCSLIEAAPRHGVTLLAAGRPELDLADAASISAAVLAAAPDIVVNAAAYTAVDKAESEPDQAFAINCEGARRVAEAARIAGAPVIQISTDYVFDGGKAAPYVETDEPRPMGIYGRSKLEGEEAVAGANPRHVNLRTAWVVSPFAGNFVKTMLRLARERPELRVVDDQQGSPTYAPDLADAILRIAAGIAGRPRDDPAWGPLHAANAGETTWCGLAREVMAAAARHGLPHAPVTAITTADYPTPAHRPANSRLDCGRLGRVLGIALPPWQTSIDACVARLAAGGRGGSTT